MHPLVHEGPRMVKPPVVQTAAGDRRWRVQFIMPARYTHDTLPVPTDPDVRIVDLPARDYAVLRFSGSRTGAAVERRTAELQASLTGGRWRSEGAPLASEFVVTSISSSGDGQDQRADGRRYLADNPFLKFNNAQRGYAVCDVTPERWVTEFKVLDKVSERGGTLTTRAKFAVASGDARVVAA